MLALLIQSSLLRVCTIKLMIVAKIISVFVMKVENRFAIILHALRCIHLMLNFKLQRKPVMKCQQPLIFLLIHFCLETYDKSRYF